MQLCLSSTFFLYSNTYFSQIFGTAMTSPIISTIVNLIVEELENEIITSLYYVPILQAQFLILYIPYDKVDYTF